MSKKITKNTIMAEILAMPQAGEVLAKYQVPCLTCPLVKFEMDKLTIGDVCQRYGLDCSKILAELNKLNKAKE